MGEATAIRITKPNGEDPSKSGEVTKMPIPEPKQGEVLVKVLLRPVNPADIFTLMGVYPGASQDYPNTPGLDGYGIIEKAGPGASRFAKGARVAIAGFPTKVGNGTWTEYMAIPETDLVAVPDSVSDEDAAQFFVNPVTVYGMIHDLHVKKGDWILFTAAGSALCRMGIHLAKHYGYKTIGLVRRDEQREEVIEHGADACVSSASEDVPARIKEITGGGAAGAIESVGGKTTSLALESLLPGSKVLLYGAMSGFTAEVPIMPMLFGGLTMSGFWLHPYMKSMTTEQAQQVCTDVMDLIAQKVMQPGTFVGKVYRLEDVAAAVQESVKDARGGKVFLDSR